MSYPINYTASTMEYRVACSRCGCTDHRRCFHTEDELVGFVDSMRKRGWRIEADRAFCAYCQTLRPESLLPEPPSGERLRSQRGKDA